MTKSATRAIALLFVLLCIPGVVHAHGGEDHSVPSSVAAPSADGVEVAAAGESFEVVLRASRAGGPVTVWIADLDTSAPVSEASATLALHCEGAGAASDLSFELHALSQPGTWTSGAPLPAGVTCGGALSITAGPRSDLLEIADLALAADPAVATVTPASSPRPSLAVVVGLGALLLGLAFGIGIGRRGRAALVGAALLLGSGAPHETFAHGGEDHGAPIAAAASPGAGLTVPMASQFLLEIRTARARREDFVDRVQAYGTLRAAPGDGAELRAPVSGVLVAPDGAAMLPGRSVRAGQVLALLREGQGAADRVDTASAQADARLRLAQARADLTLAARDAARADALPGVLSERERVGRQEALAVAQEAVRRLETAADQAGDGVVAAVRSPMDGVIASSAAHPGDSVEAGSALFVVVGAGALQVEARLPEALGGSLLPGADALVRPAALPDLLLPASLIDPGQVVDPATGTLPLTLQLAAPDARLKPGMSVRVSLAAGPPRSAVVVPDSAVVESGGQPLVFVKTGPESFEVRAVRAGRLDGDRIEILAGVSPGERVVVAGTYVLRSLAGR